MGLKTAVFFGRSISLSTMSSRWRRAVAALVAVGCHAVQACLVKDIGISHAHEFPPCAIDNLLGAQLTTCCWGTHDPDNPCMTLPIATASLCIHVVRSLPFTYLHTAKTGARMKLHLDSLQYAESFRFEKITRTLSFLVRFVSNSQASSTMYRAAHERCCQF